MKAAILTILLLTPVSLAIIYRPPPRKPPFDRIANERRVLEIKEMIWRAQNDRVPVGRLPSPYPKGYPSDPDCMSWEGQP